VQRIRTQILEFDVVGVARAFRPAKHERARGANRALQAVFSFIAGADRLHIEKDAIAEPAQLVEQRGHALGVCARVAEEHVVFCKEHKRYCCRIGSSWWRAAVIPVRSPFWTAVKSAIQEERPPVKLGEVERI